MGTSENFCLRWNDFESNVSGSFKELRNDCDFFDVTLATSDSGNKTVQAHKVILSACSKFFKQMLRQQVKLHSHPHPFIFLRGVSYNDLLSVLDFMYHGEVNVAQDDLNSFLAVAEELQIKGLTNKEQSEAASSRSRPPPARSRESGPPVKKARRSPMATTAVAQTSGGIVSTVEDEDEDIKEVDVKHDPEGDMEEHAGQVEGYDDSYGEYYGEDSGAGVEGDGGDDEASGTSDGTKESVFNQDPSAVQNFGIVRLDTGQGKCLACGKIFSNFHNCRTHYKEIHLDEESSVLHECHICGAKFRLARSKANHLMKKHGISQKMLKHSQFVA